MKEFLLENWQLIASVGLAFVNAAITFFVHRLSTLRIAQGKEDLITTTTTISDALTSVVKLNEELIERINDEKKG